MAAARLAVDQDRLRTLATKTTSRMENRAAYEAGQPLVTKWGGVLAALRDLLDVVEQRIPNHWLASISEAELRAAADAAAQLAAITCPVEDGDVTEWDSPKERRARCPMNQRRLLHRRAARARQHMSALLGTVGHGAAPYADAYATACWRERQEAAKAYGLSRELVFEDGTRVCLWDVMCASRKARLATLYVQAVGLDEWAKERGMMPVFVTLTLPSSYHPNPGHGLPYAGTEWDDAPCPGATDREMQDRWRRLQAWFRKTKEYVPGLRVVEPHADGCPH